MLSWSPAVLLTGPRQSGKTTLCKAIQEAGSLANDYTYFTFVDPIVCEYANSDPIGFVDDLPSNAILDEVQLAPEIYRPLKKTIDERREPGRFLLTASAQLSLMSGLSESLVGRMSFTQLYPFAQCEIDQDVPDTKRDASKPLTNSKFLQSLFEDQIAGGRIQRPRLGRDLARRVVEGGYPDPRSLPDPDRREWHKNYIQTIALRDVSELTKIRRNDVIPQLAKTAAASSSQLLNLSGLAGPMNLSRATVSEYVSILQSLHILSYVPPWSNNRLKRTVKQPKLHFVDTGLACALLDLNEDTLWSNRQILGQMTESLVVQELFKQATWFDGALTIYHYRDRDRTEVVIVIEKNGQGVAAIEVKIVATVRESDFRGLRKLRENSENFVIGIVLYDGEWTIPFGESLYAVPISKLWEVRSVDEVD